MSEFFLFLDFETTGLDFDNLTVLETAWTVTDSQLQQRSPLRSRLTALSTSYEAPNVPLRSGGDWGWTREIPRVVRDMHTLSGLKSEWLAAHELSILRRIADLDRLIVDDLLRSGVGKDDTVYIAGAGVSHFDRRVLDHLGSGLVVGDGALLHYRAADVSSAITLLGVEPLQKPRDLDAFVLRCTAQIPVIRALVTDESTASLTDWDGETVGQVNQAKLVAHRAASDVAMALVQARVLRSLVHSANRVSA